MNGWDFCKRIKSDQKFKSIPVIALTIVSLGALQEEVADTHLVKPSNISAVCEEIERLLVRQKPKGLEIH